MSDLSDDPFERAAMREHRARRYQQWARERGPRRLRSRLKWFAFFTLTLPLNLLAADWEVTPLLIVHLALLTLTGLLVAWAWIDTRFDAAHAESPDPAS